MSCLFTRRSLTPRANCLTIDADHSMTGKNQARKIELYRERGLVRRLTLFDFTGNVPLQVAKDKAQFIGPVLEKWIGYRNLQNATVALVDSFVEDGTPLTVCSAHRYAWYEFCPSGVAGNAGTVALPSGEEVRATRVTHPAWNSSLDDTVDAVLAVAGGGGAEGGEAAGGGGANRWRHGASNLPTKWVLYSRIRVKRRLHGNWG